MSRVGGARLAVRTARRFAVYSLGRSILVTVLVAIPILGLAAAVTVEASQQPTLSETASLQLGHAQALLHVVGAGRSKLTQDPFDPYSYGGGTASDTASGGGATGDVPDVAELLPANTRLIPVQSSSTVVRTATGIASLPATEGAVWDPALTGAYRLVDGRRPHADDEVMVSPAVLTRIGVELGGTLTEEQPVKRTFTVVGTLQSAQSDDADEHLYGRFGVFNAAGTTADRSAVTTYVPDLVLRWPAVERLNRHGVTALSRNVLLHPDQVTDAYVPSSSTRGSSNTGLVVVLAGAFGLFETCLLAGAAFAVSTRHRQRGLAILSSVGATRRMIFAVMSIEGIIVGVVGGVVGVLLGVGLARVAIPMLAQGNRSMYPGFHIEPWNLAAIVTAAALSGWIAAAVPAWTASRVDVVAVLHGARRPPRTSNRRPIIGFVVAGAGLIIAVLGGLVFVAATHSRTPNDTALMSGISLLVAGPVMLQIGVVLVAPLLLRATSGVLSGWGAGARLGSRDASRNPGRTVPALAAIMSCVFVASFALCMVSGSQAQNDRDYSWQGPLNTTTVSLYSQQSDGESFTTLPGSPIVAVLDRDLPGAHARILSGSPDFGVLGNTVPRYVIPRLPKLDVSSNSFLARTGGTDHITVGSVDDLEVLLGGKVSAQSAATLSAGGAVALALEYVRRGHVTFDTFKSAEDGTNAQPGTPIKTESIAATVQKPEHPEQFGLFVTPATANRLGMPIVASSVVSALPEAPTTAALDRAREDLQVLHQDLGIYVEQGPTQYAARYLWAVVALTTLIAIAAAAIALALARADARRDAQVLVSIGASPGVQRSYGFWQGIIIAGVGAVIGVLLGLVPAFALGLRGPGITQAFLPFTPPVLQLILIAVGMPILVATGAWVAARQVRSTLRTRRSALA